MKLTAKQIIFILMCILLVLVIVMGSIVLSRVSGLLQLGAPSTTAPSDVPSSSESIPESSSVIPSSSQQETTAPHVHDFKKGKTVSATCDTQGYTLYNCSCGKSDIRDFKDPLGHKFGAATVIAATCETDGYTERVCSRCGKTEHTNPTTAGHKFSTWATSGTNEQRTCSGCKVTEIRSLDTTKTWVIRKSTLDPQKTFTHYQIVVDLKDTETDPAYEIYTNLTNKNLSFDYTSTGLALSYKVGDEAKSYQVPASAKVLTIYADGSVTTTLPAETPDPTPSTGPSTSEPNPSTPDSQPESQPDSQPDSQPTSQPTSQPDSQPDSQPSSSGPADEDDN